MAAPADEAPPHRVYGQWRSSAIGGGGYLQQVTFCPSDPQRLYLAVDVGGLYRSDDGGRTWRMLHGALPPRAGNYSVAAIAVHPDNADELVIATGSRWAAPEGIYLSRDGGQTWRQTLADAWFMADGPHRADGLVLARDPAAPSTLLAASIRSGVFRSNDGGETWSSVGLPDLYPTAVLFDRRGNGHVWLASAQRKDLTTSNGPLTTHGGLFFSDDHGRTWRRLAERGPREFVQDPADPSILFGLSDEEQVVCSTDGGRTWTAARDGLPPRGSRRTERDPGLLRALAAGPDFLLVGGSDGSIYRRDVGARAWTKIPGQRAGDEDWFGNQVEPPGRRFGSAMGYIAIDPRDPNHWCFTDWYALYQSFDAGRTWQMTIDGIEVTVIHCLAGSPADGRLVHMGMGDNGYFRSTDGGQTFLSVGRQVGNNIKALALSPADPNRLYATGPASWGWHANQVYISDDGGVKWRRSAMKGLPDMSRARCNTVAAGPGDQDVWLAVSGPVAPGEGGAYRSTDGGRHWEWIGRGLPAGKALFRHEIWVIGRELAVGADGTVLCASHQTGQAFRLDPSTQTWMACTLPGNGKPHDLVAASGNAAPGRFFLARGTGGIVASDDGGITWTQIHNGSAYHLAVHPTDTDRLAAATDDGVILSEDGGRTWRELDKRLPYRVARLPLAFAGDRLIVGTAGSGVFWIELPSNIE